MGEKSNNRDAAERTIKRVVEHERKQGKSRDVAEVRREISKIARQADKANEAKHDYGQARPVIKQTTRTVRAVYNIDTSGKKRKKWF